MAINGIERPFLSGRGRAKAGGDSAPVSPPAVVR
jgi:hypothetical protein